MNGAVIADIGALANTGLSANLTNTDAGTLLRVDEFAFLTNSLGAILRNTAGAALISFGTITNTDSGTKLINEFNAMLGLFPNLNNANQAGAKLINDSNASLVVGNLTNTDHDTSLINQGGATVTNLLFLRNQNEATLTNTGAGTTLRNLAGATLQNLAGSTLINQLGATLRDETSLVNDGSIQNSATFLVAAGATLSGTGTYTQTAGLTRVDGTVTQPTVENQGGRICGNGTINGNLINNGGTPCPGVSPGTLTVNGDFLFNSGILEIEVGGLNPGDFDVLNVTGMASFTGGTIEFDFLNGFVPHQGDSIPFLLAGSVTGLNTVAFASTGLPPGSTFEVRPGGGGLEFIAGAPPTQGVPEPGTLAHVAGGVAALAYRRLRASRRR